MDAFEGKVAEFWAWFVTEKSSLERELDGATWTLVSKLDRYVRQLDERLNWDIGPGDTCRWRLVISPGGERALLPLSEAIIARAPPLPGWELEAARPPRNWIGPRQFEYDGVLIDAVEWQYALVPREELLDVVWVAPNLASTRDVNVEALGVFLLECEVGEKARLERFGNIEIVVRGEADPALELHPIAKLRAQARTH
jgi:hypothetical protein